MVTFTTKADLLERVRTAAARAGAASTETYLTPTFFLGPVRPGIEFDRSLALAGLLTDEEAARKLALPWTVVLGFLSVVTSARVFPNPLTPEQALTVIDGWLARPNVVALEAGPEHWGIVRELMQETGTAGSLVSDAPLAAMAIERGAELCSSDADFARYTRLKWVDPVRGAR